MNISLSRLGLGAKAVIFTALLVFAITGSLLGASYWVLSSEFMSKARADIDVNLRTLALIYADSHRDAEVRMDRDKVGRVAAPRMPSFADHAMVDRATAMAGGVATVFVYDPAADQFIRRTTNLKNEKGERAVGTSLAADHPAQRNVRRGEAYMGGAVLFGRSFFTAYQPVLDPSGKTIGLLFVGMPMEHYDLMLSQALRSMSWVAGVCALFIVVVTTLLVRRGLKPLAEVTTL
jgi:methyl-accepting chemotaxis protein